MQEEDFLSLTQDQLFIILGKELSSNLVLPLDNDELKERGKIWFERMTFSFKTKICQSSFILSITEEHDTAKLITGIADLIVSILPPHIAPFTVASIILKIGLKKFCNQRK